MVCALLGLALGYQLGRMTAPPPVRSTGSNERQGSQSPAPGAPAAPVIGSEEALLAQLTPPEESDPAAREEASPAKAALEAFLTAPDWTSRLVHVLHADYVLEKIEALAASEGDGPIGHIGITSLQQAGETAVFHVTSERHPDGYPVAVAHRDGRWLVDWMAFAEFHYGQFRSFVKSPPGQSGIFRLLVTPESSEPGPSGHLSYRLAPPDPAPGAPALVAADSPARQQIQEIIDSLSSIAPQKFAAAIEAGGIPLVLHVSTSTIDGQPAIVIQRVIAKGWGPLPPGTQ
jgi:hypothetical protein